MGGSVYAYCSKCKKEKKADPKDLNCPNGCGPFRFYAGIHLNGKRYRVRYDPAGNPHFSYDHANTTLFRMRSDIQCGTFDPIDFSKKDREACLFEKQIDRWLEAEQVRCAGGMIDERSMQNKRNACLYHAVPFFGGKDIREIKSKDLTAFHLHLIERKGSNGTIARIFSELRCFFRWLHSEELIERPPMIPQLTGYQTSSDWITSEVQDEILEEISERYYGIFLFLFRQGCRPAEARGLRWEDVNLDTGIITIRRSMTTKGRYRPTTKSGRIIQQVVHPDVRSWLLASLRNSQWVFTTRTGKPLSHSELTRIWRKVRKKLGITMTLYQATRHSFASQKMSEGCSIYDLATHMGHSTIRTTERYAHGDSNASRRVMENRPYFVHEIVKKRKFRSNNNVLQKLSVSTIYFASSIKSLISKVFAL